MVFYFLCYHPFLLSYTTQSKIAVPLSEKPTPKKVTKKACESEHIDEETYLGAQSILKNELIQIGHKDMVFSTEDFLESNNELDSIFDFVK